MNIRDLQFGKASIDLSSLFDSMDDEVIEEAPQVPAQETQAIATAPQVPAQETQAKVTPTQETSPAPQAIAAQATIQAETPSGIERANEEKTQSLKENSVDTVATEVQMTVNKEEAEKERFRGLLEAQLQRRKSEMPWKREWEIIVILAGNRYAGIIAAAAGYAGA